MLPKKGQSSVPCQLSCFRIISGRGVVVESVIGAGIKMNSIFLLVLLKRSFIRRPTFVYPFIIFRVVDKQRGINLQYIFLGWLAAVKWYRCLEFGHTNRHHIGYPACKAKANDTYISCTVFMLAQPFIAGNEILEHLLAVSFGLKCSAFII